MSNIPKETIEKISTDASARYPASPDGMLMAAGYAAGATEWAGRAQGLVDALERIYNGDTDHPHLSAYNALAKYKEVSNA